MSNAPRKRAPGGGRKRLDQDPANPTIEKQITMPRSDWLIARELGAGNHSKGIRDALHATVRSRDE